MSFDSKQFHDLIGRILSDIDLYSTPAVKLLLGTAAQESHFGTYLRQVGGGPALGVFQMEPATENDIWLNYLNYRLDLAEKIRVYTGLAGPPSRWVALETNLAYQIAMARVHYRRVPEPLPAAGDVEGMGRYWKKYYNTPAGAGSVEEFVKNYKKFVEGI